MLTEAWLIRKGGHAQRSGRAGAADSLDAPRPCVHPGHALLLLMAQLFSSITGCGRHGCFGSRSRRRLLGWGLDVLRRVLANVRWGMNLEAGPLSPQPRWVYKP